MAQVGKVARLPFALRNQICEWMLDGMTGIWILEHLVKEKEWLAWKRRSGSFSLTLTQQNLSAWRRSGFQEWKKERAKLDSLKARTETAFHIAEMTGGNPAAVGSRILAGRLTELLADLDDEQAASLAKALSALQRGENDSAKLELERERLRIANETLALEKDRFRRQTCELFLKWHSDQKALAILDGAGSNDSKIQALLAYMAEQEKA